MSRQDEQLTIRRILVALDASHHSLAALEAAAERAMEYKMGALGLRTIIEGVLLDVMYEIPSLKNVQRCVITGDTILGKCKPELTFWTEEKGLEEIA